jgi:hypothetical protein
MTYSNATPYIRAFNMASVGKILEKPGFSLEFSTL